MGRPCVRSDLAGPHGVEAMTEFSGRLRRVWYELFESDRESLVLDSEPHTLDREIRLEFDTGDSRFVTWGTEPID